MYAVAAEPDAQWLGHAAGAQFQPANKHVGPLLLADVAFRPAS
jgi:hypothetical protein